MPGRPPDYDVCIVQEYALPGGGPVKANWYKVGVAWLNAKSGSISLTMANLPGVKIVLVKPKPRGTAGAGASGATNTTGSDGAAFGEPQYEGKDPF